MPVCSNRVSQGIVATRFGCGGICNDIFIANFPQSAPVKNYESPLKIDKFIELS